MPDNVKYNLLGFNQEMICFLNKKKWIIDKEGKIIKQTVVSLQPQDLFLLDWFIDDIWKLKNKNSMSIEKNPEDGEEYVNIQYPRVAKYFPFLFRNRYTVTQSFERMLYLGLLKHFHYKNKGRYSYFKPNEEMINLMLYNKKRLDDNKMGEAFDEFLDKFVVPNEMFLLPTEEVNKKNKPKKSPSSEITRCSGNGDDFKIIE